MAVQHEFFNLANDNSALLIVPLEKSSHKCWSVTSCVCIDSRTLSLVTWNSLSPLSNYNGFERSKESITYCLEEDTCDFNNASETWNRRLESWKPKWSYGLKQHWSINYPWFRGTERPVTITYSIKWHCERPYHVKDIGTAQISAIRQGVLKLVYSIVSEKNLWLCL
jgi:hypothetical protein